MRLHTSGREDYEESLSDSMEKLERLVGKPQ
jgi:hypothetical protein